MVHTQYAIGNVPGNNVYKLKLNTSLPLKTNKMFTKMQWLRYQLPVITLYTYTTSKSSFGERFEKRGPWATLLTWQQIKWFMKTFWKSLLKQALLFIIFTRFSSNWSKDEDINTYSLLLTHITNKFWSVSALLSLKVQKRKVLTMYNICHYVS